MNRLLRPVRRLLSLRPRAARGLEVVAAQAQGKGWIAEEVADEVRAVRQLLGPAADNQLIVLDVGANAGGWTLAALDLLPEAHVFAFEPSAAAFATLSTLEDDPRVSVFPIALGDANGEHSLFADRPGSRLGSLTRRRLDHLGITFDYEEKVEVKTLETWASEVGLDRLDVLKMDVEGHELAVLEGAGQLLASVSVVQFEFGGANIDSRTYFQDFWYLLRPLGFSLFRLGPGGLFEVPSYQEHDEFFVTANYFAVRQSAG